MAAAPRIYYRTPGVWGGSRRKCLALIGASNMRGNNEGPGDTFGTSGWSAFPTGLLYVFNGVVYTSYTDALASAHGPEMGFFDRVQAYHGLSNLTGWSCVKETVLGTNLATIRSTVLPAAITNAAANGCVPSLLYIMVPDSDTQTSDLGNDAALKMADIEINARAAWGQDLAIIWGGPLHEDDTAGPGNDAARRTAQRLGGALTDGVGVGRLNGLNGWNSEVPWQALKQSVNGHLTHAGQIAQGTDLANLPGVLALFAA